MNATWPQELDLSPYLEALRGGRVVACATETQMGLLADALDAEAVARVAALKGRDANHPIALLLPSVEALSQVAQPLPRRVVELCQRHWPGPLTVLVPARPELSPLLCSGGLVGVRVPGPSPALALVQAFGGPLTATSANRAGEPAAITADDARSQLDGGLLIVPADAPGAPPSTVVAVSEDGLRVVREGAIGRDLLDAYGAGA